jgi:hypothetical protein
MVEAIHSSEIPVLTRATRRHIQEDDIPHNHGHGNLKFYLMSEDFSSGRKSSKETNFQVNWYRINLAMLIIL